MSNESRAPGRSFQKRSAVDPSTEKKLLRFLNGELSQREKRQIEERIANEPALRDRYERLEESWKTLSLPPAPPLPEDFSRGVEEAARAHLPGELSWSGAPFWARAGTALALAFGLVLGIGAGHLSSPPFQGASEGELDTELIGNELIAEFEAEPLSLAESYWLTLEESDEQILENLERQP